MILANKLSNAYIPFQNNARSETEKYTEIVHMANHLAITEPQLKEIQQLTSEDEILKEVMIKMICILAFRIPNEWQIESKDS